MTMSKVLQRVTRVTATLVTILTVGLYAITPAVASAFAAGSGSEGSPYQIASCADLLSISDLTAHYLLTETIDCSADGSDVITGSSGTPFSGTFDGGWHTITVDIDTTGVGNVGLFGYVQNATIERLTVDGSVSGDTNNIGMVAGVLDASTVEYVTSSGTVTSTASYVGGMFGRTICSSTILASTADTDVTGNNYVGGFSGRDIGGSAGFGDCSGAGYGSTITDSAASGDVTGNDYTGGFVGIAYDADFIRVRATGFAHGHDNVGGLAGYWDRFNGSRKIFASYATGAVTGRYSLGGLVGFMPNGEISQSFATGNVTATGGDDIGGLVGRAVTGSSMTVRNSYARGAVNTGVGSDASSLVGYGQSTTHLINSYGTGLVTATICGGGLHGCGTLAEVTNTFWDTQTTGQATACATGSTCDGTGATTAQMKTKSTFTNAGWDFTDIWGIDSNANNGYPYLVAQLDFLCEQVQLTSTTGRMACGLSYVGNIVDSSAFTWQARYRKVGDAGWTNVDIDDSTQGTMVFRNLDPATDYQLSVKPTSSTFANWAVSEVTTRGANSDVDNDGTLDSIENNGPNKGDTGNDGVLDALQGDTTTVTNSVSGAYTSLISTCTINTNVSVSGESTSSKDAAYDYSAGLMTFTATGCGSTATFTQYFYGNYDASKLVARKYNASTGAYTTIPGAVLTNVTIGGQSALKIVYQIVDNSSLDENATVGTITDPSGPGLLVVGAPNTGLELVQ